MRRRPPNGWLTSHQLLLLDLITPYLFIVFPSLSNRKCRGAFGRKVEAKEDAEGEEVITEGGRQASYSCFLFLFPILVSYSRFLFLFPILVSYPFFLFSFPILVSCSCFLSLFPILAP